MNVSRSTISLERKVEALQQMLEAADARADRLGRWVLLLAAVQTLTTVAALVVAIVALQ